ncbi:hypothetical protein [Halorussus sp. MSC15.2]|uniref:hypothetical protein n=1 Tax=Halorussus sp. MSC15.2 TaxID=2283638 RepID=UPI0013D5A384|nr:hypothetical protein [Halorussus sp. MSC15.2]NEU55672.1 hypothetical protein [Halorussus sp. MSC15.2]
MKSKMMTLTVAVVTMLTVVTGGIVATDDVSSDSSEVVQPTEPTTATNNSTEYDERLTADESFHIDLNESQMDAEGDDVVRVDMDGSDEQADETVGEGSSVEYDERLTADESFRTDVTRITSVGDGLVEVGTEDDE